MGLATGIPIREGSNSNWEGLLKWWTPAAPDGTHTPARNLGVEDDDDDASRRVYQISYCLRNYDPEPPDPEDYYDGEILPEDIITPAMLEDVLDELREYVGSIDVAKELHSADALLPLLYNVMYHEHAGVRAKAAETVTSMVQNNPTSQLLVLDEGDGLPPLLYNISDPDVTSRTKALGAISALIRNNNLGITAFGLDGGYAKLWDALSTETESIMFQRDALNLIQYLLCENSSDCNIVTELGFPPILMNLTSDDAEVREAALRVVLVLARDGDGDGNNVWLAKNGDELKNFLQDRIAGISAMALEDLGGARAEIQLVDSLWNACFNEPSFLRGMGLLEDAPDLVQHS